mmetsp:Transcript_23570/g.41780  ORF Transcript_23570/g.41780 Transcript_23570/m.41780 type:complete len:128 (+) Transcript_23570:366-749(+)
MCYCEYEAINLRGLGCRHFYCAECYAEYLKSSLSENGLQCLMTKCPARNCQTLASGAMFKALLSPPLYDKYKNLLVKSFFETRLTTKYCPGTDCKFGVDYEKNTSRSIVCDCGFVWCFSCKSEGHQP